MKKTLYIVLMFLLIIIVLFFKPVKVKVNIFMPKQLDGLKYYIEINNKRYEKSEMWIFPGKYDLYIISGKNKINRELKVPHFMFSKLDYNVYLDNPKIEVKINRVDFDQINIYLNSYNYEMNYWKIKFNDVEYKTTLDEYKLFLMPYEKGTLNIEGYIQNTKVYEKSFYIESIVSEIKDYKMIISDYIEIKLELEDKDIEPIKYEIYKDGKFIETIESNIYKDKFSYDEIKYEIIPIYPHGYKGRKIEITKPRLIEIPEKINKKDINIGIDYKEIILNGKKFSPENFREGENELNIILNEKIIWNKKIYLDSTPPDLKEYNIKYYNGKFHLELKVDEKSRFELITDESTYVFEKPYIEFNTLSKIATLTLYDELNNVNGPITIDLNPFPKYNIKENEGVNLSFEKDFPAEFCELRILDDEDNIITKIDVRNINEFSFSNFQPGKEYIFILYIDSKFQKEIYRKVTKPILPNIKSFKNIDVGTFEIEYFDSYKYNYYKIEVDDYIKEGVFEGNKMKFEIPLKKLTQEGTLSLWREFKGFKTEKIRLKIKDEFLYGKKLFDSLPDALNESTYIVSDDLIIDNLKVKGVVEINIFPEKKVEINGPITYKDSNSKIIFKSIKNYFQGINLNYDYLSNVEIYNANIGIVAKNKISLYNLVIKKCKIGIKGNSGNIYNGIFYDNIKGIEMLNGDIEIKNSWFFDNETTFSFYNSNAYLYNISVVDSILDIELYESDLKIKNSSFLNSIESINSNKSKLYISYVDFKNNKRSIKSINDLELNIQNSQFINSEISIDAIKSPFNIQSSNFKNNEKAIILFNSENDLDCIISDSHFEDNKIDIYIDGGNDIHIKNTNIKNYFDGTVEKTWINERGKILERGKIIFEGGEE